MPRSKTSLASNPIRVARESQNKTLEEFAKLCGVHFQALYLNESGCYPTILPSIMSYLIYRLHLPREELVDNYLKFISLQREHFELDYSPYSLPEPLLGDSPVVAWRESLGLSRSALVKSLCVQPSLISRVEKGITPELPEQFKVALLEVHFPLRLIEELEERVEEFYHTK